MTSLGVTPWRVLVDGAGQRLADALVVELGPTRAATVSVRTGPGQVAVAVTSPSPDRWGTLWVAVVELAALWAHDVFDGAVVDLVVDVDGLQVVTAHRAMAGVAAGDGFDEWRGAVSWSPRVAVVGSASARG